jgi:hypothetical protein
MDQLFVRCTVSGFLVGDAYRLGIFERPLTLGVDESVEFATQLTDVDGFAEEGVGGFPTAAHNFLNVEYIYPVLETVDILCKLRQELVFGGCNIGHWSKSHEEINLVPHLGKISGQFREHYECPVRMTSIGELLLTGLLQHVVNHSRQVELAHLHEAEVPVAFLEVFAEFEARVRVLIQMASTVDISSIVAQPHIVALVHQHESQVGRSMAHPSLGTRGETMLQEDYWLLLGKV